MIFNHACNEISPLQLLHVRMWISHKCEFGKEGRIRINAKSLKEELKVNNLMVFIFFDGLTSPTPTVCEYYCMVFLYLISSTLVQV